jgi:hypothetical protein
MTVEQVWLSPAPERQQDLRPATWSLRKTAVAVVAAVGIAAATTVGVSFADTGSSSTTPGAGFNRGGFGGGGAGRPGGFGGLGGFGRPGLGGSGTGQGGLSGPGQPGLPKPDPTIST